MTLKQYYQNFLSTTQRSDTVTLESAFRAGYLAGLERGATQLEAMRPSSRETSPLFWDIYDGSAQELRSLKEEV